MLKFARFKRIITRNFFVTRSCINQLMSEIFTKITVYYSSWSCTRRIFVFRDCFSGQMGNTALCLKKWAEFVFGRIYLHQTFTECVLNQYTLTFTECVSNQWTYFDISTCQMWLQVMERSLILLRFLGCCFWIVVSLTNTHRLWV